MNIKRVQIIERGTGYISYQEMTDDQYDSLVKENISKGYQFKIKVVNKRDL